MKKRFVTSFDELIRNYYGTRGRSRTSAAVDVDELFASYYGKPPGRTRDSRANRASIALSLSRDDGEILTQRRRQSRADEYVVQHSTADESFEEYVVEGSALSKENSVATGLADITAEDVSPAQEYQVDIFPPPKRAVAPNAAHSQQPHAPVVQSESSATETSQSQSADEDDFIADMQSILSGQRVFDPVSKKTVEKERLGQSQSSHDDNRGQPMPEARNGQAIFDRIAQSMQYANAYDLGTVELENRFSDFDRISEIQQKAKPAAASTARQTPARQASTAPAVDSADFIQDLDAIQKQRSTGGAQTERPSEPSSQPIANQNAGGNQNQSSPAPESPRSAAQSAPVVDNRPPSETCEGVQEGLSHLEETEPAQAVAR